MIATHAQKRKEPAELHESEVDRVTVKDLEKLNQRYTQKDRMKKDTDKNRDKTIEVDEPRNDLPFRDVPELETVPSDMPEKDCRENGVEAERHIPAFKTRAPVEDLELDDLLDRILKADVTVKLGTLLKSVKGTRDTL